MPITLTTSQAAAAASPAAEPEILIDQQTDEGLEYHWARQPITWSGINYAARLLNVSQIQTGIRQTPDVLPAAKTLTYELANADAAFSGKRPSWLRGQQATYREVFLDVESFAARTFKFQVTHQAMPTDETFRVEAEDILASVRRLSFPGNDTVITTSLYPNLWRGDTVPQADGINRPIPWLFGRTFCPLYYADQTSDGSHLYVACIGSAYFVGSGAVVDWFDGGFSIVGIDDPSSALVNDGMSTFPWSVSYAVRNVTRFDGSSLSMPVTEIVLHPFIAPGSPVGRRFADLTWNRGSSAWSTPDEVLIWMFRDCFAGPHFDPVQIDSDSLLAAHSWYTANSIFFDGAIIEQRPLEQWLGLWQHDAMTRLNMRDKLYLVPANSRASTSSFHAGNILTGEIRYQDLPLGQEQSRRTLFFKERTRDADYGPGTDLADNRGGSQVRWDAGSGAEIATVSPYIGRPSVSARVVQYWAKNAFYGIREYELGSTVKQMGVEDGDLSTLTSSIGGASTQLCEVLGTLRQGPHYTFTLGETNYATFSQKAYGPDPLFGFFYERIPYAAGSYNLTVDAPTQVVVASHHLQRTPTRVRAVAATGTKPTTVCSLINGALTNDSQFQVANGVMAAMGPGGARIDVLLAAWDLQV